MSGGSRIPAAAALLAACVLAAGAAGAGGPGTTGASVLRIAAGARPEGLGGAYAAVADDLNALFWNPAGLAGVTAPELGALYAAYVAQTNFQVLGYAQPAGRVGTLAGAASFFDYGNLTRTVAAPDGLYGGTGGKVWAADGFATAGWGRRVADWGRSAGVLDAGASAKVVVQHPGPASRVAIGGSAGVLWRTPLSGLSVGMVADNVGALTDGSGFMPATWRAGVGWSVPVSAGVRTLWAADAAMTADAGTQAHAGLECTIAELVALRGGWSGGAAAGGVTFGLGVFVPGAWIGSPVAVRVDYAGGVMDVLGLTHRIQLLARWGRVTPRPHGFKFVKEGGTQILTWEGGREPFEVVARRPGTGETVPLTDKPSSERRCSIAPLDPGAWLVTIRGLAVEGTAWRREDETRVKVTIPAAKPVAKAAPAAPLVRKLAAPADLKLANVDGRSWLVWSGTAPGWVVLVRGEEEEAGTPVNLEPVTEPQIVLPKLKVGRYAFTVRAVDPADHARDSAESQPLSIDFTPRVR